MLLDKGKLLEQLFLLGGINIGNAHVKCDVMISLNFGVITFLDSEVKYLFFGSGLRSFIHLQGNIAMYGIDNNLAPQNGLVYKFYVKQFNFLSAVDVEAFSLENIAFFYFNVHDQIARSSPVFTGMPFVLFDDLLAVVYGCLYPDNLSYL